MMLAEVIGSQNRTLHDLVMQPHAGVKSRSLVQLKKLISPPTNLTYELNKHAVPRSDDELRTRQGVPEDISIHDQVRFGNGLPVTIA